MDISAEKQAASLEIFEKMNAERWPTSVLDIFAASGSEPLPTLPDDHEVAMKALPTLSEEQTLLDLFEPFDNEAAEVVMMDISAEKQAASLEIFEKMNAERWPPSVLDIFAASGSEPLPTLPDDHEVA